MVLRSRRQHDSSAYMECLFRCVEVHYIMVDVSFRWSVTTTLNRSPRNACRALCRAMAHRFGGVVHIYACKTHKAVAASPADSDVVCRARQINAIKQHNHHKYSLNPRIYVYRATLNETRNWEVADDDYILIDLTNQSGRRAHNLSSLSRYTRNLTSAAMFVCVCTFN